jgi:hypothetical protein
MARVTQLRIQAPHAPGTLAQICTELAKVAVNINGIMAAPEQPEGIRILAAPLAAARKTLDQLGFKYQEEEAIAVRVNDRPGALGRVTRKLADAGINVTYAYGSIVKGEERALIVIGVSDIAKADKLV